MEVCHCNKCKGQHELKARTVTEHCKAFGIYKVDFTVGEFTDISVDKLPDELFHEVAR